MPHWGYCQENGPQTWSKHFPEAAGQYQSPIDIKPVDLKSLGCEKKLEWKYNAECVETITNTGHGWKVSVNGKDSSLNGGPLKNDTYQLLQFHCHWGKTDDEGSEHTIAGEKFAGELHLVHWNTKYSTVHEAVKHPDGLAVLGVFLQPNSQDNEEMGKIVSSLEKVEFKDEKTNLPPINLYKLLPENGGCGYYTYQGSLTTPPCSECVIWIVFKEPIQVSKEQLNAFRKLKFYCKEQECPCNDCEGNIKNNFRPTLPLGQRDIMEGR